MGFFIFGVIIKKGCFEPKKVIGDKGLEPLAPCV